MICLLSRPTIFFITLIIATNATAQRTALRVGGYIQEALSTGDTHLYVFDADSDYYVLGQVEQLSVNVVVRILKPDGGVLRTFDSLERGPELFSFETEEKLQYTIEITPFEQGSGSFTITLERLEPIETDPKKRADQLMARYDRDDSPGGVISVFRDGKTIFSKAYGMANLSYDIPFEVDTR